MWRCWLARRATTQCCSATRTPRSIRAPCRPVTRGCSATRACCLDFAPVIEDPWEKGSPAWGRWLAARGFDVPANPHDLYQPIKGFPGAEAHGSTWAPARFPVDLSQTSFVRGSVIEWLEQNAHAPSSSMPPSSGPIRRAGTPSGTTTAMRPRRSGPFVGCATPEEEGAIHPLGAFSVRTPEWARRGTSGSVGSCERRTTGRSARWTTVWSRCSSTSRAQAWPSHPRRSHQRPRRDGRRSLAPREARLLGRSYHVPLIVVAAPEATAARDGRRGRDRILDVLPTICDFMGMEVPRQADGWSLDPFLRGEPAPRHWRDTAHFD